jgi:hypothetical protein
MVVRDWLGQLTRLVSARRLNIDRPFFKPGETLDLREAAMMLLNTPSKDNLGELSALAQTYFDAAYEMDAGKFATIFCPTASITQRGDNESVVVTPLPAWLDAVGNLTSPRDAGVARADEILTIAITRDMALLKLRLRTPSREVTDLLSCFHLGGRWQIVQKVFAAEARD